jgi:SAM-dependent methyltransferase
MRTLRGGGSGIITAEIGLWDKKMDNDRDQKISAYWEDPQTSSMNDKYIATLETEMIRRHIPAGARVLDLGCGDGSGSVGYRAGVRSYFALERSWKMLREFQAREGGIPMVRGDLRALPFSRDPKHLFPVVITQRALINLPDEAAQEEVLNILPELVQPGGSLLLCEAFREGSQNLNALRQHLGFDPIPARWHNVHLTHPQVEKVLSPRLELAAEEDLSTYFFLTRVVNQALSGNVPLEWDRPFNKIAFDISQSGLGPQIRGWSHITLQVWKKKR